MSLIGRGVLTTLPVEPFCRVAGAQSVTQPWHTDPLSPDNPNAFYINNCKEDINLIALVFDLFVLSDLFE